MGRAEKKFQKRKDRERAVRKKILRRRGESQMFAKKVMAQDALEKEVNKSERKNQPIRNISPELKKTLESVKKLSEQAFEEDTFVPLRSCGGPPAETFAPGK